MLFCFALQAEFGAMLAKCAINRPEVPQRIFAQFAHIVGFGRKKRCVTMPQEIAMLVTFRKYLLN